MTDEIAPLWLDTLQQIFDKAAHEVKDSLNGVSLNLEVIRSRSTKAGVAAIDVASFAEAASGQFEALSARTEAILALARTPRSGVPVDLTLTLKALAAVLVPAARADGGTLRVETLERSMPTGAPPLAVRLALAAGILALLKGSKAGRCTAEAGAEPVVRFSHESAGAVSLDPVVASALAGCNINTRRSDHDLLIVFPGS